MYLSMQLHTRDNLTQSLPLQNTGEQPKQKPLAKTTTNHQKFQNFDGHIVSPRSILFCASYPQRVNTTKQQEIYRQADHK